MSMFNCFDETSSSIGFSSTFGTSSGSNFNFGTSSGSEFDTFKEPEKVYQLIKESIEKLEYTDPFTMKNDLAQLDSLILKWKNGQAKIDEIDEEVKKNIEEKFTWKDMDNDKLCEYISKENELESIGSFLQHEIDQFVKVMVKKDKELKKKLSLEELEKLAIKDIISNPSSVDIEKDIQEVFEKYVENEKVNIIKRKDNIWKYLPSLSKKRDFMKLGFREILKKCYYLEQENEILKIKLKNLENGEIPPISTGLFIQNEENVTSFNEIPKFETKIELNIEPCQQGSTFNRPDNGDLFKPRLSVKPKRHSKY